MQPQFEFKVLSHLKKKYPLSNQPSLNLNIYAYEHEHDNSSALAGEA